MTPEQALRLEKLLGKKLLENARRSNYEQLRRVCEVAAKLCEQGYSLDKP